MAFPPNYNQERKSRENAKHRKAMEKQNKRDEKSAQRKQELEVKPSDAEASALKKDL